MTYSAWVQKTLSIAIATTLTTSLFAVPVNNSLPTSEEHKPSFSDMDDDEIDIVIKENTDIDTDATSECDIENTDQQSSGEESPPAYAKDKTDPKVLYDPALNYGPGAPKPTPAPYSTKKRNLYMFAASCVLATVAMLVVSTNTGRDAPKS